MAEWEICQVPKGVFVPNFPISERNPVENPVRQGFPNFHVFREHKGEGKLGDTNKNPGAVVSQGLEAVRKRFLGNERISLIGNCNIYI